MRTLARYMAWANDKIYDAVAALPEREVTKPRRSVFKNIVHTLDHVYLIDLIFQVHLKGRGPGSRDAKRRTICRWMRVAAKA